MRLKAWDVVTTVPWCVGFLASRVLVIPPVTVPTIPLPLGLMGRVLGIGTFGYDAEATNEAIEEVAKLYERSANALA